jgi:hypothetical protein
VVTTKLRHSLIESLGIVAIVAGRMIGVVAQGHVSFEHLTAAAVQRVSSFLDCTPFKSAACACVADAASGLFLIASRRVWHETSLALGVQLTSHFQSLFEAEHSWSLIEVRQELQTSSVRRRIQMPPLAPESPEIRFF